MTGAGAVWSLGDYARVAPRLWPVAEALVAAAGIRPGDRVLDVAAGTGNVALAAAARGATVVASDIAPAMVAAGRARTQAAGAAVTWQQADAEALPFATGEADSVLSALGVMFAPRPHRAAAELFRVVRPGGTVALTSWTRAGFTAATAEALVAAVGTPPTGAHPLEWGDPLTSGARLGPYADRVELSARALEWRFDDAEAMLAWLELAGPYAAARRDLPADRYADLRRQLLAAIGRHAEPLGDAIVIRPRYLLAVARARG